MLKRVFSLFAISILILFSIISCQNFASGDEILSKLDETIKYANSPSFSVRIQPENTNYGDVLSGAQKDNVKVSDTFEIEFLPKEDYVFLGWDAVSRKDHKVSYRKYVFFEEPEELITSVTVIGGNDAIYAGDLLIVPKCRPYERANISFDSDYGIVSNYSNGSYKEGTEFNLRFTLTSQNYAFTHWEVMVGNTIDTTGKYVKIENIDRWETVAKLIKKDEADSLIHFIPVCEEKPTVISKSPSSDKGALRDGRIKVIFDVAMDDSSIYYSSEEIEKLKEKYPDVVMLGEEGKYHGYKTDDNIYYKNIEIKKFGTKTSLLSHYGAPYFSTPEVLVIPPMAGNLLPTGTEILVSLSPDFCYKTEDGYSVAVGTPSKWNFYLSSQIDTTPPTIETSVKAKESVFKNRGADAFALPADKVALDWDGNNTSLFGYATNVVPPINSDNYEKYYARDGKIYLNISVNDEVSGSGPAEYLKLAIYDVDKPESPIYAFERDYVYRADKYTNPNTISLKLSNQGSGTAVLNEGTSDYEYDLNVVDGTYKIYFIAEDENGNEVESNHYYVYVKTGYSNISRTTPACEILSNGNLKFTTVKPSNSEKMFYQQRKLSEAATDYSSLLEWKETQTITGLDPASAYMFKVIAVDRFGNVEESFEFRKNTRPNDVTNVESPVVKNGKIEVKWQKPTGNYAGAYLSYVQDGNEANPNNWTKIKVPVTNEDTQSYSIPGVIKGQKYYIKLQSYDEGDSCSGENLSNPTVDIPVISKPEPVTNLQVLQIADDNSIKLTWNEPALSVFNHYSIYKKASGSDDWEDAKPDNSYNPTLTEQVISGLTPSKSYVFKVVPVNEAINNPETEEALEVTALVAPNYIGNLSVTETSADTIKVQWTETTEDYDGVVISYKKASASEYVIGTPVVKGTAGAKSEYTITGLDAGSDYSLTYYTYKENVSKPARTEGVIRQKTKPNSVTDVSTGGVSGNANAVTLRWTNPVGSYTGIVIYSKYSDETDELYKKQADVTNKSTTSIQLNGFLTSKIINFKIETYYGDISNSSVVFLTATSGVGSVGAISVTETTNTSISVSWVKPTSDYDSVKVYWKKVEDPDYNDNPITVLRTATSQAATITALDIGQKYDIRLEVNYELNGKNLTSEKVIQSSTRPKAASNVRLSRSGSNLSVVWDAPGEGKWNGYYVFYNTSNNLSSASFSSPRTDDSTNRSYTRNLTGLTAGTKYYVWVIPYAGYPDSVESSIIKQGKSFVTATGVVPVSETTKPLDVTGLEVSSVSENTSTESVSIKWSLPSSGSVTGYRLYVKDLTAGDSSYTWKGDVTGANNRSYTFGSLVKGHQYSFMVVSYATDLENVSAGVEVSCFVHPPKVTGLTVSRNSTNPSSSINVSWTNPNSALYSGLRLYYSTDGSNYTLSNLSLDKTSSSCTLTGLNPNTGYYIRIATSLGSSTSMVNADGSGSAAYATSSKLTTAPNGVTGLTASSPTTTSLTLKWTNPSTAAGDYINIYQKDLTSDTAEVKVKSGLSSSTTSASITGLTAGHNYQFRVVRYNSASNNENLGTTVSKYTRPNNVTITKFEQDQSYNGAKVLMAWTFDGSQKGFHIYRNTTNSFDTATYIDYWGVNNSKNYEYTNGLSLGATYYYWFVSYIGTEPTRGSTPATIKTLDNVTISDSSPIVFRPNPVTGLKASSTTPGSVALSWTKPSSGGYSGARIYYRLSGATSDTYYGYVPSNTSCTVSDLLPGREYVFTIKSYYSTSSNYNDTAVSVTTYCKQQAPVLTSVSTYVYASENKANIVVNWTNPSNYNYPYISFAISETNDISTSVYKGWEYARDGSYTIEGLSKNKTYYVWIGCGESGVGWKDIYSGTDVRANYCTTNKSISTASTSSTYIDSFIWPSFNSNGTLHTQWIYTTNSQLKDRNDLWITMFVNTTNQFSTAVQLDFWNHSKWSSTSYDYNLTSKGITPVKGNKYYVWYTVTASPSAPSSPSAAVSAASYISGYYTITYQ